MKLSLFTLLSVLTLNMFSQLLPTFNLYVVNPDICQYTLTGSYIAYTNGGEVVGNIIHCKLHKGRFTKENKMVDVKLNYDSGLSKYYGLVDIAVKYDIFKKVSTRIELPDGEKVFEKTINENPEKYFTKEVMEKLEVAVAKEFKYGSDSSEAKAKE